VRKKNRQEAGKGPSTLVPPEVPQVEWPTSEPVGGATFETTANAEKSQATTEEDEAPVSDFYRAYILRVAERSIGVRSRSGPGAETARVHLAGAARWNRVMGASCAT
jgi:hypothetical protein